MPGAQDGGKDDEVITVDLYCDDAYDFNEIGKMIYSLYS